MVKLMKRSTVGDDQNILLRATIHGEVEVVKLLLDK